MLMELEVRTGGKPRALLRGVAAQATCKIFGW